MSADDGRKELDERLRRLLDVSSDAVFLARTDGAVLHASETACRMFGYSPEEARRLTRKDLCVADERLRAGTTAREEQGLFKGELTLIRKGGERFVGELTSTPVSAEPDETRLWIVVHDLSERRALRESEETFRALAEASFEGIFLHRDGTILLANAVLGTLYREEPSALVGRRLLDFVAPEDRDLVLRRVAERFDEPYAATALRADGTRFPVEVHARNVPVSFRGEPTRVVAVRDITARKELEARLALVDRMASLGTLAAGVAHEINNPLAVVMLNLELARKVLEVGGPDREKLGSMLVTASESAERVQRIVRDLRALARPVNEPPALLDLDGVMEYVQNLASYQIRHRAKLTVRIDPIGPVYGSRARLEQVLLNLVINAAQAIPDDGAAHRIDVVFAPAGDDRFVVEVEDTGVGIPPELRARIFDPFVTTKAIGVGTGLGLSICHTIVESMGGTIEVRSDVGKGTTFRVVLPRGTPPSRPSPAPASSEPKTKRRARILVVDDEKAIRDVLVQLLAAHDVTALASATEAIERLEKGERFDVVLCDLMMPGMNGADLHEAIEQRFPDLLGRVVLMTGGAVTARAREALVRAKNPPLDKPFLAPVLEARIDELLG